MKFSGYQRAVGLNTPQAPRVQAPRDELAYGAGGKSYDGMAAAVGQANKVAAKIQDDNDAADVMEARNRIMTNLTNGLYGEEGLFTTGIGQNAKGLTDRTNSFIKDTFENVSKDYNGRVQKALRSNLNENMANYQRIAASQESKERETVKANEYKNSLTLNADMAGKNYADVGTIDMLLSDSSRLVSARGADQGIDGLTLQQEQQNVTSQIVGSAINAALSNDDYDTAESYYNRYGTQMNSKDLLKYNEVLKKEKRIVEDRSFLDSVMDKCRLPDGSYDYEKIKELVHTEANSTKEVYSGGSGNYAAGYSGNSEIDSYITKSAAEFNVDPNLVAAVAEAESGYRQNVNSDVGAIGVMQLMPATAKGLKVNPNDTGDNIRGGSKYLRELLDSFNGDVEAAVAHYNCGPNGNPDNSETRSYTKKVMARYNELKKQNAGYDIAGNTYYKVKPGKESEVEGLNNNTWTKLNILSAMWERDHKGEADYEPLQVTAAAATGGHNSGSKHYEGLAVDIAMDYLENHPDAFEWLDKYGAEAGFKTLNEYPGYPGEKYADGANYHLSDDGTPYNLNLVSNGGSSEKRIVRRHDASWEDIMLQKVKAKISDDTYARKQKDEQTTNLLIGKLNGMSKEETLSYLDKVKNDYSFNIYSDVRRAAATYNPGLFNVSSAGVGGTRASGGSNRNVSTGYVGVSGTRYTASEVKNAYRKYKEYVAVNADPNSKISIKEQLKYDEAASIINDIEGNSQDNLDSKEGLSLAVHAIEVNENDEEAEWYLINNGFSETEAKHYVQLAHAQ